MVTKLQQIQHDSDAPTVSQSQCAACYESKYPTKTFKDCWRENPQSHTFPDKQKIQTGSFKVCLMGIMGISGNELNDVKTKIKNHNEHLTTTDIITTIELGFPVREQVFKSYDKQRVTILYDHFRPLLINQTGHVIRIWDTQANKDVMVVMDNITQGQIRRFQNNTRAQIQWPGDPLDGTNCITIEGGDMTGWCKVRLDVGSKSITVRVPTGTLHPHHDEPIPVRNLNFPKWDHCAVVTIKQTYLLPEIDSNGSIPFTGDFKSDKRNYIAEFDPYNQLTPKIFDTYFKSMGQWTDVEQKAAVAGSICDLHERQPTLKLQNEELIKGDTLHIEWEMIGMQSVFEGVLNTNTYVVCRKSTPEIARLGTAILQIDESTHIETVTVIWEDGAISDRVSMNEIFQIHRTCILFYTVGSRVVSCGNMNRIGTVKKVIDDETRLVSWEGSYNQETIESVYNIQRKFLMQNVKFKNVIARVKNIDKQKIYSELCFKGTANGDRIGSLYVSTKELNRKNIMKKLQTYMQFPGRKAHFTIQERVGVSILDIADNESSSVRVKSETDFKNLFRAIGIFMEGLSNMHEKGFMHSDAHWGNITFQGPLTNGEYKLKLIDFDRLERTQGNPAANETLNNDIIFSLWAILRLVQKIDAKHDPFCNNSIHSVISHIHQILCSMPNTDDFRVGHVKPVNTIRIYRELGQKCMEISGPLSRINTKQFTVNGASMDPTEQRPQTPSTYDTRNIQTAVSSFFAAKSRDETHVPTTPAASNDISHQDETSEPAVKPQQSQASSPSHDTSNSQREIVTTVIDETPQAQPHSPSISEQEEHIVATETREISKEAPPVHSEPKTEEVIATTETSEISKEAQSVHSKPKTEEDTAALVAAQESD